MTVVVVRPVVRRRPSSVPSVVRRPSSVPSSVRPSVKVGMEKAPGVTRETVLRARTSGARD